MAKSLKLAKQTESPDLDRIFEAVSLVDESDTSCLSSNSKHPLNHQTWTGLLKYFHSWMSPPRLAAFKLEKRTRSPDWDRILKVISLLDDVFLRLDLENEMDHRTRAGFSNLCHSYMSLPCLSEFKLMKQKESPDLGRIFQVFSLVDVFETKNNVTDSYTSEITWEILSKSLKVERFSGLRRRRHRRGCR